MIQYSTNLTDKQWQVIEKIVDSQPRHRKHPLRVADFTPEQIIALTGKSAYQIWMDQPGNEGKTVEEYIIANKGQNGVISVDAPKNSFAYHRYNGGWKPSAYYINADILTLTNNSTSAEISEAIGGSTGFINLMDSLRDRVSVFISSAMCTIPVSAARDLGSPSWDLYLTSLETAYMSYEIGVVTRIVKRHIHRNADFSVFTYEEEVVNGLDLYNIFTLSSLSVLSPIHYSQKFTLPNSSPKAIAFSSAPKEGFECILTLTTGGAYSITQPLPNGPGWVSNEASVIVTQDAPVDVSIRYMSGKCMIRV